MKKHLNSVSSMLFIKKTFLKGLYNAYMMKIFLLVMVFFLLSFLKPSAQIIDDGNEHFVPYNGTYQDYEIPNNPLIVRIRFRLTGGDGGYARIAWREPVFDTELNSCKANGGTGAILAAEFKVGSGPGKIPHGSIIRFIIGEKGSSGSDSKVSGTGAEYGGGGGGTAVLYRTPTGSWILLAVAGGGGGAYQSMVSGVCFLEHHGIGGQATEYGASGTGFIGGEGIGGNNGAGGGSSSFGRGGGGGGSIYRGGSVSCIDADLNVLDVAEGGAGRDPFDGEVGGYGGSGEGCSSFPFDWRNGGFGYGGGGAGVGVGGGGGGYSGGGAGAIASAGGGGGSFVHFMNDYNAITGTGNNENPNDGSARYEVTLNQPPVAVCKNATVYLSATGQASIVPADVNNGSSDPDNSHLTYSLSKNNFTCSDVGNNNVMLTVTDNYGASSTCIAFITVIDNTIPVITCPANITVSCSANVPPVNPGSVTATDNCPVTVTHVSDVITNQTCASRFTLTRTYKAKDASGNTASCSQVITVFDNTPPVITDASTNITSLWPANHKMKDVIVNYTASDNCSAVNTTVSVSSNEPLNGTGDGDTAPDWEIVNNHLVRLRAERAGSGNGRIYTITIKATDGCNNSSSKVVLVHVNNSNAVTETKTPNAIEVSKTKLKEPETGLTINVQPNPSTQNFRLFIKSADNKSAIQLRIFNSVGQLVEINTVVGKYILFGNGLRPGIYLAEAIQGKEKQTIKLIKL